MVTLDTLRKLHEHDHQLAAYCATCERGPVLDLERLIAEGLGDYCFVGRKPRCAYCRGAGTWQLRPPALRPAAPGSCQESEPAEASPDRHARTGNKSGSGCSRRAALVSTRSASWSATRRNPVIDCPGDFPLSAVQPDKPLGAGNCTYADPLQLDKQVVD